MEEAALITGASRGIGLELARCYASEGTDLVVVARSEDRLHEIKRKFEPNYGISVRVIARDLTAPSAAKDIYDELENGGIFVHALVNNAGFGNFGRFVEHDWSREWDLLQLNVTVLTHLTHLFGQRMVEAGRGEIMNVASTGAFVPGPFMATYYASKSYVLSFSEGLAGELAEHDINVTCLCPGATRTKFTEEAGENAGAAAGQLPDFAWADPDDVAEYGYRCLKNGKVVAVYGWLGKFLVFCLRFVPRFVVRWVIGTAQRQPLEESPDDE